MKAPAKQKHIKYLHNDCEPGIDRALSRRGRLSFGVLGLETRRSGVQIRSGTAGCTITPMGFIFGGVFQTAVLWSMHKPCANGLIQRSNVTELERLYGHPIQDACGCNLRAK